MTAVADIFLLAGSIRALMDRDDFTERQRHAIRAVLNSGNEDGRAATPEEYATVRELALELCETEGAEMAMQAHLERQRY